MLPKTQESPQRYQDCHNTQFGGNAFAGMNGRIKCFTVQLKGLAASTVRKHFLRSCHITEKEAAMISAMRQADERARQDAIALLELHTGNKKI